MYRSLYTNMQVTIHKYERHYTQICTLCTYKCTHKLYTNKYARHYVYTNMPNHDTHMHHTKPHNIAACSE